MTTSSYRFIAALLLGLLLLLFIAPTVSADADPLDQAKTFIEEQRFAEALDLIVPLADAGNADAQNVLAIVYAEGWGVDPDMDKAREWFERAAAGGSARAAYNLAGMYATGRGVDKDCDKALEILHAAAETDDPVAQVNIGSLYAEGSECTPQNFDEAIRWYRMAADQDDPVAQHSMGAFYANGQGVAQSYATAMAWYRKAAAQGYADSQASLGWMYFAGQGVAADVDTACEWFALAAAQGHEMASQCLGAIEEGTTIASVDQMVEAYLSAPARDVALEAASLETILGMLDLGFNVVTGGIEINDSNREQIRMEFTAAQEAIRRAVEKRGVAEITGSYSAKVTPACSRIQSGWADGTREGLLGNPTFEQQGHKATMRQTATFDGKQPMETPVTIVENVLVFSDMMNSDFYFSGIVTGNVITITPETDMILSAWPDWVKAPSRKNLENCKVTLTKKP